jgi:hypothetical protein
MFVSSRRGLLGALALLFAVASAHAAEPATQPASDDQAELQAVRSLLQQVKDQERSLAEREERIERRLGQPAAPTTQPPAAPAGATPADLLADLQRRQLLEVNPLTATWDMSKGFFIGSEDGSFVLHPWAFLQVRDATNYRQHAPTGSQSSDSGLELPRAKFILDGSLFTHDFTYQFIWATSTEGAAAPAGGALYLQDAWGRYHIPNTGFAVRAGNVRDPFDHEQVMFGTRSLTPDRSIVANVMANGDGIVKGVTLAYGFDRPTPDSAYSPVRIEAGYTNGMRNTDTNFQGYPTNPAAWGVAGRVDWKLFGQWIDYTQFTSLGDKAPLLVVGAGADLTGAGDTNQFSHVVDLQFDTPAGLAIYAAYLGRYATHNAGAPGTNGATAAKGVFPDTYDETLRVQAAYLIGGHFEPFGRYEYLHFANIELPKSSRHDVIQDITVGANYYFFGHRAKISCAASYLPDGSPIANTQSDLLAGGRNQVIVQAQFQLMI